MHSPLLENNAACGFISPPGSSLVLQRAELRGDRMLHGGGCVAAKRVVCAALQRGRMPEPRSSDNLPPCTCSSSPCIGNVPLSPTSCCFPLCGSILSFPMADARCLPPSTQGTLGAGMALSGASLTPPHSCIPGICSRCCDIMTNTQALSDWMRHTLCLRVADISSIMALIMPLWVSGLNSGFQTEFIAAEHASFQRGHGHLV